MSTRHPTLRVQGGGAGVDECGDGAALEPTLRGQVSPSGRATHFIAVEFRKNARNLTAFDVAPG